MLLPTGLSMYVGTTYHYMDFYCSELIPKFDTDKLYTDRYLDIIEQQMMDAVFSIPDLNRKYDEANKAIDAEANKE